MTENQNSDAAGVLAALTPSDGWVIEPSMWDYSRTVARENANIDVSDDVFLMRQSTMVHCYTHTLRCMDKRPRVALLDADDLDKARTTVTALIAERNALRASGQRVTDAFRSLGKSAAGINSLLAHQECEASLLALAEATLTTIPTQDKAND